jgi:ATP-dependent Zn protease
MPRKFRERQARKVVAYHEAGHAVIARKLGITVEHISMCPPDERGVAGALTQSAGHKNRDIEGFKADATVALAGPIAQVQMFPGTPQEHEDDEMTAKNAAVIIAHIKAGLPIPGAGQVTLTEEMHMLKNREQSDDVLIHLDHDRTFMLICIKP